MENFGSAIFGLAKLKKKVTQEKTKRKKENAHDGLFGRIVMFSQCTFMYKTTTFRIISFLALKHVQTQWITGANGPIF